MNRRLFLKGISASAAIITTPGLLMPISTRLNAGQIILPESLTACGTRRIQIFQDHVSQLIYVNDGDGWKAAPTSTDGSIAFTPGNQYSIELAVNFKEAS